MGGSLYVEFTSETVGVQNSFWRHMPFRNVKLKPFLHQPNPNNNRTSFPSNRRELWNGGMRFKIGLDGATAFHDKVKQQCKERRKPDKQHDAAHCRVKVTNNSEDEIQEDIDNEQANKPAKSQSNIIDIGDQLFNSTVAAGFLLAQCHCTRVCWYSTFLRDEV